MQHMDWGCLPNPDSATSAPSSTLWVKIVGEKVDWHMRNTVAHNPITHFIGFADELIVISSSFMMSTDQDHQCVCVSQVQSPLLVGGESPASQNDLF
jgi:hypothetical protein